MAGSKSGSVEWRVGGKEVTEEEYRKAKAPYTLRKCGMAKFTRKTGEVLFYLEGRLNDLPKDYGFKPNNIKIGDLCPELADF